MRSIALLHTSSEPHVPPEFFKPLLFNVMTSHSHNNYVTRCEKTDHFDKFTKLPFLIPCDAEFSVELKNVKMNA